MFSRLIPAVTLAALITASPLTPVLANREPPGPPPTAEAVEANAPSADYEAGLAAVDAGDYERALALFRDVAHQDPDNADAFNMLGYTYRRLQNYKEAVRNYRKALEINPDHTGAHHYLGEAYLEIDNLEMAERHLRALNVICLFGCNDFDALQQSVTLYRHNHTASQPSG